MKPKISDLFRQYLEAGYPGKMLAGDRLVEIRRTFYAGFQFALMKSVLATAEDGYVGLYLLQEDYKKEFDDFLHEVEMGRM